MEAKVVEGTIVHNIPVHMFGKIIYSTVLPISEFIRVPPHENIVQVMLWQHASADYIVFEMSPLAENRDAALETALLWAGESGMPIVEGWE